MRWHLDPVRRRVVGAFIVSVNALSVSTEVIVAVPFTPEFDAALEQHIIDSNRSGFPCYVTFRHQLSQDRCSLRPVSQTRIGFSFNENHFGSPHIDVILKPLCHEAELSGSIRSGSSRRIGTCGLVSLRPVEKRLAVVRLGNLVIERPVNQLGRLVQSRISQTVIAHVRGE